MNARKNRELLEDAISKQAPEARRSLLCLAQTETGFTPWQYKGENSWNFWNRKTWGGWKGKTIPCKLIEYIDGKKVKLESELVMYESAAQSVSDIINQIRNNWPSAWRHRCEPDKFVLALQTTGRLGHYSTSGKQYIKDYTKVLKSSYEVEPIICSSNPEPKREGVSKLAVLNVIPEKHRKMVVFIFTGTGILLMALLGDLDTALAVKMFVGNSLGFFAGNGAEHIGDGLAKK